MQKSRADFAKRQKMDFAEVMKQSEQEYFTNMVQQAEEDETKRVIAESIREQ